MESPGRKDRFENGLCNLQGSFIPFAATRARSGLATTGDPRPSIDERYPDKVTYVAMFRAAAERLVAERFLLSDDAAGLIVQAAQGFGAVRGNLSCAL